MGIPSAPPRRAAINGQTMPTGDREKIRQARTGGDAPSMPEVPGGSPERVDTDQAGQRPQHHGRIPMLSGEGFCWVAAHGGAGATSLATVLGGTDVGCRWPAPVRAEPARVLLVARTHAGGLRAASRALNAMREGRHPRGMELVTLVLVADAPGSLPHALSSRVRVLRSVAPVLRIPWIPEWRSGKRAKALPKQLFRLGELVGIRPAEGR